MKVVILSAGIGSRLGDLTQSIPKSFLKINDKSIIETQLYYLNEQGLDDITVVVGYKAEKIKEKFRGVLKYIYNPIYKETNSSYSLWLARKEVLNGWLHINCDLIFHPQILKDFLNHPSQNALAVDTNVEPDDDGERVKVDKNGRIMLIQKRMDLKFTYGRTIGMAKFDRFGAHIILNRLEKIVSSGEKKRWFFSVIGDYLQEIPVYAVSTHGNPWAEVDTDEDLGKAKEIANKIEISTNKKS